MFQLTKGDNLGTNICKACAIEILKSYKFRMKYIESERKLLKMLDNPDEEQERDGYEAMLGVEVTIDESTSKLRTSSPSKATDLKWKCNSCSASFATRSQYYEHRRLHSKKVQIVNNAEFSSTNMDVKQNRWKCVYCPAEFGTNELKLKHECDEHLDNTLFHEPAVLIEDNDSVVTSIKKEPHIDSDTEQNEDFNSSITSNIDNDQSEFRYDNDCKPEVDLGLYLIEKHSQITSLDPLDINSFNDSLLTPLSMATSTPKYETFANTNSKWKCRLCTESFRTRDLLRVHNQHHMALKLAKPPVEKVKAEKVEKVRIKIPPTDEFNIPKWQCKACMVIFDTRELLRIHRRASVGRNEKTGLREMQCSPEKSVDQISVPTVPKKIKVCYSLA